MTDKAISPLRQRLIDDMAIRRLGPKTQHDYIRRVKSFADFVGHSPPRIGSSRHFRFSDRPPRTLHKAPATEPGFFIEVLSQVYRPSPESGIQEPDPEHTERNRAIWAQGRVEHAVRNP
jgi:hypothetical protein